MTLILGSKTQIRKFATETVKWDLKNPNVRTGPPSYQILIDTPNGTKKKPLLVFLLPHWRLASDDPVLFQLLLSNKFNKYTTLIEMSA